MVFGAFDLLVRTWNHILCACVCVLANACISYFDYEDPFDERQAESWDGPVASGSWGGQAERQEETDPVEQERHWTERERGQGEWAGREHG